MIFCAMAASARARPGSQEAAFDRWLKSCYVSRCAYKERTCEARHFGRVKGSEQPAQGTSGRTPVVQTTEQAQIVQKQLSVTSVKQVAAKRDILK